MSFANYIQYQIAVNSDEELSVELVQEIVVGELSELPFDSFDMTETYLNAYIKENENEARFLELISELPQVSKVSLTKIKGENWNKTWEANFEPLDVKDKIYIRAPFHPESKTAVFDIIIEPKMSFGTGHHATTQLMLEEMLDLNLKNRSVLDMGCGTSILAIMAEKLGARNILAVDNDPQCIENARENIEVNQCQQIEVCEIDKIPANFKVDIILANIQKNVLAEQLPYYGEIITPNGDLLMSGIYKQDAQELINFANELGFITVGQNEKKTWCMLHLKKSMRA